MSAYELILSLDHSTFEKLMSKGLLRDSVKRDKEIYEFYLRECEETGSRMQARTNTAELFCVSEETVSRAIKKMKE